MNEPHIESSETLTPPLKTHKNKRHGHAYVETAEYRSWGSMKQRCLNPNHQEYCNYGARGITICERWMKFENFIADMGLKPQPGLSLERRNNNLGYCKENCIWTTHSQQMRNTRCNVLLTFKGETRCAVEWSEITGFSQNMITKRKNRGWSDEDTLTRPPILHNKPNARQTK